MSQGLMKRVDQTPNTVLVIKRISCCGVVSKFGCLTGTDMAFVQFRPLLKSLHPSCPELFWPKRIDLRHLAKRSSKQATIDSPT